MYEFRGLDGTGQQEENTIKGYLHKGDLMNSGRVNTDGTFGLNVKVKGGPPEGQLLWSLQLVGGRDGALVLKNKIYLTHRSQKGDEEIVPAMDQRRVGIVYLAEVSESQELVRPGNGEPIQLRGYGETMRMLDGGEIAYPGQRFGLGGTVVKVEPGYEGDVVEMIQFKRSDRRDSALSFVVYNPRLSMLMAHGIAPL